MNPKKSPTKKRRNRKSLLAVVMTLALLMSLAITPAMAATVSEDEATAQAIVDTAGRLRLSCYDLQLKAGDTYNVRIVPEELAQSFGWRIVKAAASDDALTVVDTDQTKMAITVRAEKDGAKVNLAVTLESSVLNDLIEANPSLAKYGTQANTALAKAMTCVVQTNNTGTKAVKGVDAGDDVGYLPSDTATPSAPSGGGYPESRY